MCCCTVTGNFSQKWFMWFWELCAKDKVQQEEDKSFAPFSDYSNELFQNSSSLPKIPCATLQLSDHVSYRVPRPIHRPMHRSIYRSLLDRPSTDTRLTCRSTIDRESTDVFIQLPLTWCRPRYRPWPYRELIAPLIGQLPAGYRSTIGGMSVVYHSIVERESTDTMCRSIERYYRPIYLDL